MGQESKLGVRREMKRVGKGVGCEGYHDDGLTSESVEEMLESLEGGSDGFVGGWIR